MHEGHVYFIRVGDSYKIGISKADCIAQRIKTLKPEEILAICPRTLIYREFEKQLHSEYGQYRLPQSEWFVGLSADDITVIKARLGGAVYARLDCTETAAPADSLLHLPDLEPVVYEAREAALPSSVAQLPSNRERVEQQLALANASLKAVGARVTIIRRGQALSLQATLPAKSGEGRRQQQIALGLPADTYGVRQAKIRALELAEARGSGRFSWADWGRPVAA